MRYKNKERQTSITPLAIAIDTGEIKLGNSHSQGLRGRKREGNEKGRNKERKKKMKKFNKKKEKEANEEKEANGEKEARDVQKPCYQWSFSAELLLSYQEWAFFDFS
jgi:hypothetical protein